MSDTIFHNGHTIHIVHDEDAENPRTWGAMLGIMVCFHRRYDLGDKHDLKSPADFEFLMKHRPAAQRGVASLPLYLYDHGGLDMATVRAKPGWWHWQWDAGQVGYIYTTRERVEQVFGWKRLTQERLARIFEVLQAEVDEYAAYLRGEVYGYRVENAAGEEVDSRWGYIGYDTVVEAAKAACVLELPA